MQKMPLKDMQRCFFPIKLRSCAGFAILSIARYLNKGIAATDDVAAENKDHLTLEDGKGFTEGL